jgi:hypothetical protein
MFKTMKSKAAVFAALALTASASAFAELPTAVTGAFTTVKTDGEAMIDAGWPILVAITGGIILMKLFKRVVGKST